jgi:sigma-B regulation protein RsbU (phosphoserine phosphatase)
MVPMSAVGGDFYDLIPLSENTLGIAVGDVSDHGVPAALFMAMTVTLIRAEAYRAATPSDVLRNIDLLLRPMNDADMFVTLLYGILDYNSREFTYARAGHNLPLLMDQQGKFASIEKSPGQPIGLFPDFDIDEQSLTISPGDMLFLYTDGVTEAMDQSGDLFGQNRLEEFLRNQQNRPAQEICDQIFSRLDNFRGGEAQHDDVTVLVLQT